MVILGVKHKQQVWSLGALSTNERVGNDFNPGVIHKGTTAWWIQVSFIHGLSHNTYNAFTVYKTNE